MFALNRQLALVAAALYALTNVQLAGAVCAGGQMGESTAYHTKFLQRTDACISPSYFSCRPRNGAPLSSLTHARQILTSCLQLFELMGENWVNMYSGFLMDNNCNLIAQNGVTGSSNQACLPCLCIAQATHIHFS